MNKKSKIALIIIIGLITLVYAGYLFVIPNLINPEDFKPEIQKAAKQATGLEVDPGKLKLSTYYDFSAKLTAQNAKIDRYLTIEKASIRVSLPSLIFKKLEIEEIRVEKPKIFLTRLKNGKYDIEKVLEKQQQPAVDKKHEPGNETAPAKVSQPVIEPVFNGMKLYVSNYRVNLKDMTGSRERNFALAGDLLEISKFKPEKFIKLATNGTLLVENNPNINFDIKLSSELPLTGTAAGPEKAGKQQPLPAGEKLAGVRHSGNIDPIEKILKYDPKVDIKADLKLKSRETLPEIKGFLNFENLSIKIDGQKLPESHGEFNFSGKGLKLDSKLFITPESFLEVAGNVKNLAAREFDVNVKSTEIELKDVKKFAYSLADAANADAGALNDIKLSGKIKADFNLQKDNYKGYLSVIDAAVSHKDLSEPLKNLTGKLNFSKDKVVFEDTSGKIADIGFNITGYINSKLFSELKIDLPAINLKTVYNIASNSRLFAGLKPGLNEISGLTGKINAAVKLAGKLDEQPAPEITAVISNISACHKPSKTPISLTGGSIKMDKEGKLAFNSIKTVLSGVPLDITGEFKGSADSWELRAQTDLSKIEYLSGTNTLKINAKGSPKTLSITKTGLYSQGKRVAAVEGNIDNYTDLNNVKVDISGLKVRIKEPKGKAQLNANLVLTGKTDAPKALGNIKLTSLDIPSLQLKTNDIGIVLKSDAILVNTGVLSIVDSKIRLDADIENKLTPPFIVRTVRINSDFLNIDKLSLALQAAPGPTRSGQGNAALKQQGNKAGKGPGRTEEPDVPVIINSGKFFAKELIVNKLQNRDVSFDFTLKPLNRLAIRNFKTHTAGGIAVGIADMNLKTTKLSVDVTADNLEINALATVLANMPNEVFGGMKGRIRLSTIGKTPGLMIQNAIGKADFNINNGHLGKLGNLGYLLKTGSVNFAEAEKTNHFDTLNGQVLINRGMLDIQEIKMRGKSLSSFISGSIRMRDNHADLTVLGKLSGRVVSKLGFIADISVNKLIKQIPGQWGEILSEARMANQYPDRDRIPPLSSGSLENDKDFAVKIRGVLGQPQSVSMIEWLE